MMASRLLSIMLLLQARGRMSAGALARQFEVSVRTIHRDIDQLSAAGVPVYGDRGRAGGFALADGFRTRLTGLTQSEAETLFLSGVPHAAAELGFADLLVTAQLKLLAALPAGMKVERVASRFHLDTAAWFRVAEKPRHLAAIARAVWDQRVLRIAYRRKQAIRQRDVKPLGLVLKADAWYLVAERDGAILTYRAANVVQAEILETRFDPQPAFDLARHWEKSSRDYEADLNRTIARVRLSPGGWAWIHLFGSHARAVAEETAARIDEDGWIRCDLPLEPDEVGLRDLLRLGADVEVLDPPELRAALADTVQTMAAIYKARSKVASVPASPWRA